MDTCYTHTFSSTSSASLSPLSVLLQAHVEKVVPYIRGDDMVAAFIARIGFGSWISSKKKANPLSGFSFGYLTMSYSVPRPRGVTISLIYSLGWIRLNWLRLKNDGK